ncbi:hypothetical protein MSS2_04722 [Mycobacterium marinum]|uniref:hypothetical protein n=1 Tax=Mycobacterium marinum TaxID=1781 RepID=UPI000E3B910E|nr:hypothetical protein [Mycobacterium marinum]RFZ48555.1 hypothetical protein MSS2_04722 [Mycobacterium marinum]
MSANSIDPEATAAAAANDATAAVPDAARTDATELAADLAWSQEIEPDTSAHEPWRAALIAAAAVLVLCGIAAALIVTWHSTRGGPNASPPVASPATTPKSPVAAESAKTAAPPPSKAPPPTTATSTVTVVAPAPGQPQPQQGTFAACPSGRTGVATAVTSCAFADNVRTAYLVQGGPYVLAYSPVTGSTYAMECRGGFFAHLSDGRMLQAVRCSGGSNAVVVAW